MHPIRKEKVKTGKDLETQLITLYRDESAGMVNKENKDNVESELKNIRNKKYRG